MSDRSRGARSGAGTVLAGVGATLLVVVCCAGPALVAAGALGVAGGVLRSPLVLGLAGLVLLAAVPIVLRRRRARACRDVPAVKTGDVSSGPPARLDARADTRED
jgi:hypothetical protein